MAGIHKIETPRGEIIEVESKGGKIKAKLTWNPEFAVNRTENFNKAQIFVDSEVLRLCDQFIPFQTGKLKQSGTLGTEIGSGEIRYIAPYSAVQYYNTSKSRSYDPQRGSYWFERMKASYKDGILNGVKKITGENG
jgi:hypothetical protein